MNLCGPGVASSRMNVSPGLALIVPSAISAGLAGLMYLAGMMVWLGCWVGVSSYLLNVSDLCDATVFVRSEHTIDDEVMHRLQHDKVSFIQPAWRLD